MYYVKDENGNRVEAFTKEEFLTFLQNAIDTGSLAGIDADSAIVSKLKCCVSGDTFPISFVTQAKYNELKSTNGLVSNCYYFIIDDETEENIEASIENLNNEITDVKERLDNLGFKEGSANLGSGISATLNQITKQGHYAIFKFEGTFTGNGGGESGVYYFTLDPEFCPNETFSMRVMTLQNGLPLVDVTAGTLVFEKGNPIVEFHYYYYGTTIYPISFQVGYETEKMETDKPADRA